MSTVSTNEKDCSDNVHSMFKESTYPERPSTQIGASGFSRKESFLNTETKTVDREAKGPPPLCIQSDDDILGPETPGTKPLVSRLKRIQEDTSNSVVKTDCSLRNTSKRVKFLEPVTNENNHEELLEVTSKFEWLNPSKINDANGRRPNNPSYDKRTLYIPPDALRNMSASQKQYWTLKSQYMDVLMFFKVVS